MSFAISNPPTTHAALIAWVSEIADLAQPDAVVWCDGSDAEWSRLTEELTAKGVKFTFQETEGQHVWRVWRNYFHETAPMLFQASK